MKDDKETVSKFRAAVDIEEAADAPSEDNSPTIKMRRSELNILMGICAK